MVTAAPLYTIQTLHKDLVTIYDPRTNWPDQCFCECPTNERAFPEHKELTSDYE